jgi:hypothetical protein
MWDPRHFTTLEVCTVCTRNSVPLLLIFTYIEYTFLVKLKFGNLLTHIKIKIIYIWSDTWNVTFWATLYWVMPDYGQFWIQLHPKCVCSTRYHATGRCSAEHLSLVTLTLSLWDGGVQSLSASHVQFLRQVNLTDKSYGLCHRGRIWGFPAGGYKGFCHLGCTLCTLLTACSLLVFFFSLMMMMMTVTSSSETSVHFQVGHKQNFTSQKCFNSDLDYYYNLFTFQISVSSGHSYAAVIRLYCIIDNWFDVGKIYEIKMLSLHMQCWCFRMVLTV